MDKRGWQYILVDELNVLIGFCKILLGPNRIAIEVWKVLFLHALKLSLRLM